MIVYIILYSSKPAQFTLKTGRSSKNIKLIHQSFIHYSWLLAAETDPHFIQLKFLPDQNIANSKGCQYTAFIYPTSYQSTNGRESSQYTKELPYLSI